MKNLKIIIPILLVAILAIWGYTKLKSNKAIIDENANEVELVISEIPVKVVSVETQDVEDKLELVGTFEARKELSIISEGQGRITRLYVTEGQKIGNGQTIATIDDATIQSQLSTAKASLAKAEKDVERYKNLLEVGAISQTQFEEVSLAMQNQRTNVTSVEQQLKYSTVKSPMGGVINEVLLEQGSFASPGTKIATVIDVNNLKMVVNVDEKDIVKVRRGQRVQIMTEVYPDVPFTGVINLIGVQADASRKYEIGIDLTNNSRTPLKAGMYGTVSIPSVNQNQTTVLTIPRKCVVGSLKQPQVYVVVGSKAKLVNIEVGRTIEANVIVLSGLNTGVQVITTGQINLEDGRAIKVIAD